MPATLLLCGDVMLGRGIDQLFVRWSLPALREQSIRDARDYVTLAAQLHGLIQTSRPDVRGDALGELDRISPDARLVNLETSITTSEHYWPGVWGMQLA
jgi:poly-gamma-glutamate synthesis protein (capsule biosynthesis protein)